MMSPVTDDEGTFLALLVRVQPATAYQIAKIYADSPVSNFGTSKGKIYPLARRLKERGLLTSRPIGGDARKSEVLRVTARGREAVRKWVRDIRPTHLLPEDPLRTMVQSFDLLTTDEQLDWIGRAADGLQTKLVELEDYGSTVEVPFKDHVHQNARMSIELRIAWLDQLKASILARGARRSVQAGSGARR